MVVVKIKIGRIALFATALFAVPAMATTYWLGTGEAASDDNPGTSKDAPFASWNAAFTAAGNANNNVLNVLPGIYTCSSAPSTWGTSRNDVTIRGVDVDGNPLETAAAAAAVIIDGNALGTIAPIRASFRTVFSGLTFRNGLGTDSDGAAIDVQGTGSGGVDEQGFAVSNCVFASCTGGPAVLCKAVGGAHFVGCTFSGNANTAAYATCIRKECPRAGHPLVIESCTFENNSGSGQSTDGKGLCVSSLSEMLVADSVFTGNSNSARGVALGFASTGTSNRIERCTFRNNVNDATVGETGLTGSGGVAYVGAVSTNVFVGCTFEGNSAAAGGGCVSLRYGRFVAEDCTFTGNTTTYGSAITYAFKDSGSSALFSRCTISENTARLSK